MLNVSVHPLDVWVAGGRSPHDASGKLPSVHEPVYSALALAQPIDPHTVSQLTGWDEITCCAHRPVTHSPGDPTVAGHWFPHVPQL
jgi:hypothetical protein